jgi:chemotaxis protein MotA
MDIATLIGITLAFVGIIGGNVIEGGNPAALMNIPGFMIVVLGSLGATMISQPLENMVGLPKTLMSAFMGGAKHDPPATVDLFVMMSDKARREGLLALEPEVEKIHDQFTRKGVQLMIDGTDPELLRQIMEIDAEATKHRAESGAEVLEFWGGIAPTIGVLGAVLGLMGVMGNLDNPAEIGPGIATAFVATFYGVFTANVLWLPMAKKLHNNSKHEQHNLELVIEGLMSIQAGDNPRIVREKLEGFLAPGARQKGDGKDGEGDSRKEAA